MEHRYDLDEALKQLNGLNNKPNKRAAIIEYVQSRGRIAVFGYGSLIWNPFQHVDDTIADCKLNGYTKGFFCYDCIYRGTKKDMGLTMGLKASENGFVKGSVLMTGVDEMIPFINAFVERETPIAVDDTIMDIYTYDFLPVMQPDGVTIEYALTCVVNDDSQFFVPKTLSIEEQAEIIGRSYGMNGTNLQYLHNTMNIYRKYQLEDTFTPQMEELYEAVVIYRNRLIPRDRKWLETFDQLQTREERLSQITLRKSNPIRLLLQTDVLSMTSTEEISTPEYDPIIFM